MITSALWLDCFIYKTCIGTPQDAPVSDGEVTLTVPDAAASIAGALAGLRGAVTWVCTTSRLGVPEAHLVVTIPATTAPASRELASAPALRAAGARLEAVH